MFHLYMKNLAFRIVSLNFPIQMQILDIIVIVHQSPTAWLNAIMPPTGRSRCTHAHLPVRMHNEYEERTLTHVHLCSTSKIEIIEIVRLFIVFFCVIPIFQCFLQNVSDFPNHGSKRLARDLGPVVTIMPKQRQSIVTKKTIMPRTRKETTRTKISSITYREMLCACYINLSIYTYIIYHISYIYIYK